MVELNKLSQGEFVCQENTAKEGEEMISNIFLKSWNGYPAEPKDMGYPMVVIGSDICSYM